MLVYGKVKEGEEEEGEGQEGEGMNGLALSYYHSIIRLTVG